MNVYLTTKISDGTNDACVISNLNPIINYFLLIITLNLLNINEKLVLIKFYNDF